MIEFFIDVARECFNIGNFNSLMAIICESVWPAWGPPCTCPQKGWRGCTQADRLQARVLLWVGLVPAGPTSRPRGSGEVPLRPAEPPQGAW